jgi:hypothetical protein
MQGYKIIKIYKILILTLIYLNYIFHDKKNPNKLFVRARVQASVFPTGPKGHCDQTLQSDLPGSHLYSLPAVTLLHSL